MDRFSYSSCLVLSSTLLLSLGLLAPRPAVAQEATGSSSVADLERRVQDLEEALRQRHDQHPVVAAPLESDPSYAGRVREDSGDRSVGPFLPASLELNSLDSQAAADQRPDLAGWKDGFFLRSPDQAFNLRITGQIQADYRTFLDGADSTDLDTFLVRRARLGIEATVFKFYEFRLLPDFGQSQTQIQDAYINVHHWDAFQIEAGKFKQPFSYEQLIQDRFVPTMERSLIDQLVPARDEGVMIHGQKLWDDRLDYAIAVSNGEQNGNVDTNDGKDLAARVALRPFHGAERTPVLQGVQIGMSGATGVEQESILPTTLRTPATVPWFQFNAGVRASGLRNRWSPELSYFKGPLGFAAQYFRMNQEILPAGGTVPVNVPFEGFYFLGTWLLTGEERTTYSQAVTPLRAFDPCCPLAYCGAWELVARTSRLHVGDVVFASGPTRLANPSLYSSAATELTVGFNWYLNKLVRLQCNWEHTWFDEPVRLGPTAGGLLNQEDALLTRFQVIF